jgi:hypothetical protein
MDKKAQLFMNPGALFVGTGTLPKVLDQYEKLSAEQKAVHFINYDGKSYTGAEVEKLKAQ